VHRILLDTGAFVALLDRSEEKHYACAEFFRSFKGEVFTTEPVLTETLYLLSHFFGAGKACIEFIIKGGAVLVPQSLKSLSRAIALMEKYRDTPMDFADATLVTLAEDADINEVFTLDARGFQTYRIHGKKAFNILPR
jgi:predicted nucleic acid-binding protein